MTPLPAEGARSRAHARPNHGIVPLGGGSGSRAPDPGNERRVARRIEATFGETLTDIVRLSSEALSDVHDPAAEERIQLVRTRAVEGLEELRRAVDSRQRDDLGRRRLIEGLRDLTDDFQAQTRIFTEFRLRFDAAPPDDVAWALYSVAAQALESLERRSRATGVVMIVQATDEHVSMSIRDDGVGLLARQGRGWQGSPHAAIRTMSRTLELVGGSVTVTPARPRGLLVRAVVPLGLAV